MGLREGLAPATLLADVQGAWQTVAGEAIAQHSRPVSERGGVVTVRCESGVWAAELEMMSAALVQRLGGVLSAGRAVRELRFVVGP